MTVAVCVEPSERWTDILQVTFLWKLMHPTPFFPVDYWENFLRCSGIFSKHIFFWKTNVLLLFKFNQQAILSMACTYTEIFNNLFFRFFRNLCNILHECDSSATPENPGTNEGVAVILYHQNHDFGKYFCKLYISKHYLWWVSNAIFFLPVSFCLRVLTFYHNVFFYFKPGILLSLASLRFFIPK